MSLTKDEAGELMEIRMRGLVAMAYSHAGSVPAEVWPKLRGEQDLTLRDIGEAAYHGDLKVSFTTFPIEAQSTEQPE